MVGGSQVTVPRGAYYTMPLRVRERSVASGLWSDLWRVCGGKGVAARQDECPGGRRRYSAEERDGPFLGQASDAANQAGCLLEERFDLGVGWWGHRACRVVQRVPHELCGPDAGDQGREPRGLVGHHVEEKRVVTFRGLHAQALGLEERRERLVPRVVGGDVGAARVPVAELLCDLEVLERRCDDSVDERVVRRDRSQLSSLDQRLDPVVVLQRNLLHHGLLRECRGLDA